MTPLPKEQSFYVLSSVYKFKINSKFKTSHYKNNKLLIVLYQILQRTFNMQSEDFRHTYYIDILLRGAFRLIGQKWIGIDFLYRISEILVLFL